MTKIYRMPESRVIDYKYSELTRDFIVFSDKIGKFKVPKTFICDWESVPLLKGTSKVGGLIHDYLCREDSIPVVTKKIAAEVYLEIMKYRKSSYWRRYLKYWIARLVFGYFHKKRVNWRP